MRGEGFDGVLAQVDQRDVFPVIGFEITVVQDEAFGSENNRASVSAQFPGPLPFRKFERTN